MNRSLLLTVGKKLNGDLLHLLSVFDLEPSGIIIHAYNQTNSKEYMLPITEIEVKQIFHLFPLFLYCYQFAESGYTRKHESLEQLLDTMYLAPVGSDWALHSTNPKIKAQKTVPLGEDLEAMIRSSKSENVESIHDLLVTALVELCKVKPVGIDAVRWLGDWLIANNPNKPRVEIVEEE